MLAKCSLYQIYDDEATAAKALAGAVQSMHQFLRILTFLTDTNRRTFNLQGICETQIPKHSGLRQHLKVCAKSKKLRSRARATLKNDEFLFIAIKRELKQAMHGTVIG